MTVRSLMGVKHGTVDGYNNHGCRCTPCTRAASRYTRALHARTAAREPCSVEGCDGGLYARGLCRSHYSRRWYAERRAGRRG